MNCSQLVQKEQWGRGHKILFLKYEMVKSKVVQDNNRLDVKLRKTFYMAKF
jgi:hypothetical protein